MGGNTAPSGAGATDGASSSSVSNKNADDHFSYVRWDEATLTAEQVLTPAADAKPGEKVETPDEQLARTLHVSAWNPSLTLLYFHTPHEDLDKSKLTGAAGASFRQCKTFHNEQVVRWLSLYHPVEVDMGKSDAKTAERLGFKDGAMFAVVDQHLNVIATSKPIVNSDGVAAFLEKTIRSESCKSFWSNVQTTIDEQKKALEKARELVRQDKFKDAMEQYAIVVNSNVRVADFYDEAAKEAAKIARKADK